MKRKKIQDKMAKQATETPILTFAILASLAAFLLAMLLLPAVSADKNIEEDNTSVISCLANCTGGFCLNTKVYLQLNVTGTWTDVNYFTGNVLLNQSSSNPEVLGTINTTVQVNFTVIGGNNSFNNQLRCNVTSDFSE